MSGSIACRAPCADGKKCGDSKPKPEIAMIHCVIAHAVPGIGSQPASTPRQMTATPSSSSAAVARSARQSQDRARQDLASPPCDQQRNSRQRGCEVNIPRRCGQGQHDQRRHRGGDGEAHGAIVMTARLRCRQARRAAARTNNVHGNKYIGSSIRYFPGELRCAAAYCNSGGRIDRREAADQVVPEEYFQVLRPVGAAIDEPDPGENDRRLKQQSCIQFPSKQFAPTLLPDAQGHDSQAPAPSKRPRSWTKIRMPRRHASSR